MGTSLLKLPVNLTAKLTTNSLIKSTWTFLQENQIDLQHDITYDSQVENDGIIMFMFQKMGAFLEDMMALNQCRLFLCAYHLSDIVDGSCMYILENSWNG